MTPMSRATSEALSYSLFQDESMMGSAEAFAVASDGLLRVSGSIDFEAMRAHNLTLQVSDTEGSTAKVAVRIDVEDINEAPFVTIASESAAIRRDSVEGTLVVGLSAEDPDFGDVLTYSILAYSESGGAWNASVDNLPFEIEGDRLVRTAIPLRNDQRFSLEIEVEDLNASLTVDVTVDNGTIRRHCTRRRAGPSEDHLGGTVGTVEASDEDGDDVFSSFAPFLWHWKGKWHHHILGT